MVAVKGQEDLARAVIASGVRDARVLEALREVPRANFVPPKLAERAYLDLPLPIPHRQVTTQPSLSTKMIEALELLGSDRVLEVGTGYGFQTALLAHLSGFVWSVERWPDVAETARENLGRHGVTNVEVVAGDGTEGLPEHAPYDAILVSAAFPSVPPPLAQQLAAGGRLVQPIGSGGQEAVILFERGKEGLVRRHTVTGAHFVKLYGAPE
jgi:protein-L-isoaspartate(D-aspartate) O-methyltransferase